MNIWRRGPIGKNPYQHTAFRVTRVPRGAADRALVIELVGQIRQLIEADPEAHSVNGQRVTMRLEDGGLSQTKGKEI